MATGEAVRSEELVARLQRYRVEPIGHTAAEFGALITRESRSGGRLTWRCCSESLMV